MKYLLANGLIRILKILPDLALIYIRNNLQLVKRMDYESYPISLAVDSYVEYNVRLHSCSKEPETVKYIETFVKDGDVVFDVGANVGAYSFVIQKFTKGKAKVYAFEPSFSNFAQLNKNILINECQGSVIPIPIALSDRKMLATLQQHDISPGAARNILARTSEQRCSSTVYEQPVLSYRIDDVVKEFDIAIPNHIKLDVDGGELSVLKGANETLSDASVRSIMVEIDKRPDDANPIVQFLIGKGFKVHSIHQHQGKADGAGVCNCLFVR